MSWLVTNKRGFLHEQTVMFVLIGLMMVLHACQILYPEGWDVAFMVVPGSVADSWNALRSGDFSIGSMWPFATLITYAFLHGGLEHLANNMLYYWLFGALLNELLGWRWLLAIVLITAIGGGIIHTAMGPDSWMPMVGASGVVSGFMGAYLGLSMRWHLPHPHLWPMARPVPPANLAILAIIFVAIDYRYIFRDIDYHVAFGAHVGGFTTGLFLTCFIIPRPRQASPRR